MFFEISLLSMGTCELCSFQCNHPVIWTFLLHLSISFGDFFFSPIFSLFCVTVSICFVDLIQAVLQIFIRIHFIVQLWHCCVSMLGKCPISGEVGVSPVRARFRQRSLGKARSDFSEPQFRRPCNKINWSC